MSPLSDTPSAVRFLIAGIALAVIIVAVTISSRRGNALHDDGDPMAGPPAVTSQQTAAAPATHSHQQVAERQPSGETTL